MMRSGHVFRRAAWLNRTLLVLGCLLYTLPAQSQQNTTTQYEYDNQGNLKKITDPRGKVTDLSSYDALNRLTTLQMPAPQSGDPRPSIVYGYDALNHLISVIDPKSLTTGYTVNGLGNQTALNSPDTGTTQNTFDAAGNLATRIDSRGVGTAYTYDALDRVQYITFSGLPLTPPIAFGYDDAPNAIGKRTGMQDAAGTTLWGYDAMGRVNGKVQLQGSIAQYVYYLWGTSGTGKGRLIGTQYPSGIVVYRQYDTAGRLQQMALLTTGSQVITLYSVYGYSPFGGPSAVVWQNTLERNNFHDLDGRLAAYSRDNDYRILQYDAASRIENVKLYSTQATLESYTYDDLNRLKQWVGGSTINYQYDASGNRTALIAGSSTLAYTYPTVAPLSHKLVSTGPTPLRSFTHDNAGNMTVAGTQSYEYDARGRMIKSTAAGIDTLYTVNGLGQRVKKAVSSGPQAGTTYFVYDEEGHLLGEYDGSGNIIQEYVWHDDTPVAIIRGPASSPQIFSIETDHLGTPRQVRDVNKILRWEWDPDPFGNAFPNENPAGLGSFTLNLRFPGQYADKETNLHYNMARDYDPSLGRYIQSDPIGLQGGINTYAYVGSNPLSFVDPEGRQSIGVGGAIAIIGGALWSAYQGYHAGLAYGEMNCETAKKFEERASDPEKGTPAQRLAERAEQFSNAASTFGPFAARGFAGVAIAGAGGSFTGAGVAMLGAAAGFQAGKSACVCR